MTSLIEKGTGSSLTATEWNVLKDKLTDGTDSINTGSVVISGTAPKVLSPTMIGSPGTWGAMLQVGSGAVGAGSDAWLVFNQEFSSTPIALVSKRATGDGFWIIGGSLSTGSAYVQGDTASSVFDYVVVGAQ